MKKQLLLFAFSTLALTSCEDDDYQAYELDLMKGDWKVSKTEIVSGKDNKTVLETTVNSGCSAKNTFHFRTDYYTSYSAYTGTGADCQLSVKNEGTYTYSQETKDLVIQYDGEDTNPYKVIILSSTEMKIMQLFGNTDHDGDLVIDTYYITLKR